MPLPSPALIQDCPKDLESKLNKLSFNLQKKWQNRLWFRPSQEKLFPTCHASYIRFQPPNGLLIRGLKATDGAPRDLKGQSYGEKWIWSQNAESQSKPYTFWTLLLKHSGSYLPYEQALNNNKNNLWSCAPLSLCPSVRHVPRYGILKQDPKYDIPCIHRCVTCKNWHLQYSWLTPALFYYVLI